MDNHAGFIAEAADFGSDLDDLQAPWLVQRMGVCVAAGVSICFGTNAEALAGLDENWSGLPCRELCPWFRCSFSLVEGTFMSGVP